MTLFYLFIYFRSWKRGEWGTITEQSKLGKEEIAQEN